MLDHDILACAFERIGARAKIELVENPDRRNRSLIVNIRRDKKGEYFYIRTLKHIELLVLDLQPKERHLLLLTRDPNNPKAKFLCGHDERHWFTAAIPENAPVSTVEQAKQALKPSELVEIELSQRVRRKDLHKRIRRMKTGGKIFRQGEFMFVPAPEFKQSVDAVLKDDVLSQGGNPHRAEYLYREGGTTVYVCRHYPNGVTQSHYDSLLRKKPEAKKWNWQTQVRNPGVYVKGKIRHPEHATLDLGETWHRVIPNAEPMAKASSNVDFID